MHGHYKFQLEFLDNTIIQKDKWKCGKGRTRYKNRSENVEFKKFSFDNKLLVFTLFHVKMTKDETCQLNKFYILENVPIISDYLFIVNCQDHYKELGSIGFDSE